MLIAICSILALLLAVALLYPFYVHGDFSADLKEGCLRLSFLRWNWSFKHAWKNSDAEKPAAENENANSSASSPKTENWNSAFEDLKNGASENSTKPKVMQEARKRARADSLETEEEKLSDREFFTLLMQPNMVSLAWKYLVKLLNATFRLFHFRFFDSFVEGIKAKNPARTGYLSAFLNALPSVIPALAGFVFVMDWTGSEKLGVYGKFTAQINLLRLLIYVLLAAYIAVRLVLLYFWMRYRYKKDATRFELSWWRKKIVDFIAAED